MAAPSPTAPPPEQARTSTSALLLLGWLSLVLAGCALAVLAHSAAVLPGDLTLARELQERRGADLVLDPLLRVASVPGNAPWDVLLYGAAVASALLFRHWPATLLVGLTATGDAMGGTVKLLVARARPTADLVTIYRYAAGYSFPSGHVVHYVVFFGVVAYLCARALRSGAVRGRAARALLWVGLAGFVALIALVGPSRVYLGAHWPSDVVGGYVLGGAWLALLLVAHQRWIHPWWARRRPAAAVRRA